MSVVIMPAVAEDEVEPEVPPHPMLPLFADWTVDDLDRLPDDGMQYELLDGTLLVSPGPVVIHQRVISRLHLRLAPGCPADAEIFFSPLDWRPDSHTSLQPDLLIATKADQGENNLTLPLLLAVEVLSPSTRKKDRLLKFAKYEEAGVGSYWMIDPKEPSIVAYDLVDGAYVEVGRASGEESITLQLPYPVSITPGELV